MGENLEKILSAEVIDKNGRPLREGDIVKCYISTTSPENVDIDIHDQKLDHFIPDYMYNQVGKKWHAGNIAYIRMYYLPIIEDRKPDWKSYSLQCDNRENCSLEVLRAFQYSIKGLKLPDHEINK